MGREFQTRRELEPETRGTSITGKVSLGELDVLSKRVGHEDKLYSSWKTLTRGVIGSDISPRGLVGWEEVVATTP